VSGPGTAIQTVDHAGFPVHAIAFSADSARFASGGEGAAVLIRAVKTGPALDIPVKALLGLRDDQSAAGAVVSGTAFSPDGANVVVAVNDQVAVASTATGVVSWRGPIEASSAINFVAYSPDGKQIIAATDTHIAVLNAPDGHQVGDAVVVDQTIVDADLSRDGKLLAVAIDERHGGNHHDAGSARIIDLTAGGSERGRLTPGNAVYAVAFSPNASTVLCGSADGTTRMFKSDKTATELWNPPVQLESTRVAFDPTGTWTVVGGADNAARILEAESGVENIDARVEHDGAITHVAFSPNGQWAASTGIDNILAVVNVETGAKRFPPKSTAEVLAMTFSPNSGWLGLGLFGSAVVLDNGGGG
jgi:WD40 repeat protein